MMWKQKELVHKDQCFDLGAREHAVNEAIDLASADTARMVLKRLCAVAPNVKQMVEDALLAVEESCSEGLDEESDEERSDDEDSGGDEGSNNEKRGVNHQNEGNSGTKKRKYHVLGPTSGNEKVQLRYLTCRQCEKEFDVTKNHGKACTWHDGDLEVLYEHSTWDDWDVNYHGKIDSDTHRKEFPEGFMWSCCEEDGMGECCMRTAHKEVAKGVSR